MIAKASTVANGPGLEIVFSRPQWTDLQGHLFGRSDSADEQMALLLAAPSTSARSYRLIVRELIPAGPEDLAHQSTAGIGPTGEFVADALTRCAQEGWSLIEVHSHPFDSGPATTFSGVDWANDRVKMPALARLLPEQAFHATVVMGRSSLDAHYYDRLSSSIQPAGRVVVIGAMDDAPWLSDISPTSAVKDDGHPFLVEDRHSRQLPLVGSETQAVLAQTTVAIVGLGGLGSFVALELAHLGVGGLVLIDPDVVEDSNLNRLVGVTDRSVGHPKVKVYESLISEITPRCKVVPVACSIVDQEAIQEAKQADVLMGCVDTHGARLVANQLAVQYLLPLIDGATGVRLDDDRHVTHAGGQVQVVLPGVGCLSCRGFVDARQAAFDLAPAHVQQRERAHGYGTQEAAPSVIFLNGVVASIQVDVAVRLLSGFAGFTKDKRSSGLAAFTIYDLLVQSMTRATNEGADNCPTCGPDGVAGLADLSPLYQADAVPVPEPISHGGAET